MSEKPELWRHWPCPERMWKDVRMQWRLSRYIRSWEKENAEMLMREMWREAGAPGRNTYTRCDEAVQHRQQIIEELQVYQMSKPAGNSLNHVKSRTRRNTDRNALLQCNNTIIKQLHTSCGAYFARPSKTQGSKMDFWAFFSILK